MSEPVAWAGIWVCVGFGLGYLVAWLRTAWSFMRTNREVASMTRKLIATGNIDRALKLLAVWDERQVTRDEVNP